MEEWCKVVDCKTRWNRYHVQILYDGSGYLPREHKFVHGHCNLSSSLWLTSVESKLPFATSLTQG
jgi:hypothetical protein